jgi:hypothetical protein
MDAIYEAIPLPEFNNNPLVEALSCLCKPEFQAKVLAAKTEWCPAEFWQLPKILRLSAIARLNSVHIPAPQLEAIYEKVTTLLLSSYARRQPMAANALRVRHLIATALHEKHPVQCSLMTTAPTCLICGPSGIGKTAAIRIILQAIPQVINHTEYQGVAYQQQQLVWISIDLPATPSIKALALNFFLAVDQALGTDEYYKKWSSRNRDSVDQHILGMQLAAQTHELGLIHIDEMQFMLNYAKSKDAPSMVVLEAIFNKLGIPMLLSTTTAGLKLFAPEYAPNGMADVTIARRMLNDREIQLKPLDKNSPQFQQFVKALFPREIMLNCSELSPEFIDQFYELSCGIPAFMIRLAKQFHDLFVQRVHKNGNLLDTTNDVKMLRSVYHNQFKLIAPALAALRNGQTGQYEKLLPAQATDAVAKVTRQAKSTKKKELVPFTNPMFAPSESKMTDANKTTELKVGSI